MFMKEASPKYLSDIELNILVEAKAMWYLPVKIAGPHQSISAIGRPIYRHISIAMLKYHKGHPFRE